MRDGASVVVRGRESRPHGEGGQETDELAMTEKSVDSDARTDKVWLLNVQRKLYQWSRDNPEGRYRDVWNWVTDIRNLRCAWRTVAANKGKRTPGVDGVTVRHIISLGEDAYLEGLRGELRAGSYKPRPTHRVLIPKPGKPGEFRPLGIPTVKDRIVQCAVKQIVEPLFEARFWHVSYGFRPGRSCHGALEHVRMTIRPRAQNSDGKRHRQPYAFAIEGDIKGCFDHIDHRVVMERLRRASGDRKTNRVILAFLKAGVLAEDQFLRTEEGTPQGGIISPLLANIALGVIEERYARWVYQKDRKPTAAWYARISDRKAGRPVFYPVRYADDFVVLVSGTYEDALREVQALERYLKETARLELSREKTRITPLTTGFEFLGHRVRIKWDDRYGWTPRIEIPKNKFLDVRYRVKQWTTRGRTSCTLEWLLAKSTQSCADGRISIVTALGQSASSVPSTGTSGTGSSDGCAKKYPKAGVREIMSRFVGSSRRPGSRVWREGRQEQFLTKSITVQRFKRGWMRPPDYALVSGEPDA